MTIKLMSIGCQNQWNVNSTDYGANRTRQRTSPYFAYPATFAKARKISSSPLSSPLVQFHHGNASVRAMEENKWRFLRDFLSRGDHISLKRCLTEIKLLEEITRRCYSERVALGSDDFAKMMLLDGCFVVEYFLKWYEGRSFIFQVGWDYAFVLSDLLLLENQIPFFIVKKLCEIGLNPEEQTNFTNYLGLVLARGPINDSTLPNNPPAEKDSTLPNNPPAENDSKLPNNPPAEIHHLVHLSYHFSIPNPGKPVVRRSKSFNLPNMLRLSIMKDLLLGFLFCVLTRRFTKSNSLSLSFLKSTSGRSSMMIPCATELQNAGIKLRSKTNPRHMLDISFDRGVLEIPTLIITDDFKPFFVNLVAFEQCRNREMSANLTSFASFLHSLVNTQEDVMILQRSGIVENCLSSEEELTIFFNQASEGVDLMESHFLAELFAEVNIYMESRWNRRRVIWNRQKAKFIHDYFSIPWAAISLVAAVVLVLLTCVQSFFAVYAYYVPPR